MAEISKITLPSGNTYDIKDATARQMISGGVSFIIAWDGTTTPVADNIPAGVVVTYNETQYTGTLSADSATAGAFYLVKSSSTPSSQTLDIYDEYVPIGTAGSKSWEKIGDTQLNLTDVVTDVTLNKQVTDVVTGYSSPTSKSVIGASATFSVTQPTITVTPTTTSLSATASGATVGANGTASAITGFGDHTTDTFVKSVSAETNKKLVTTSITPTNGTETVSKVTQTDEKLVTTSITPTNGTETVSKVTQSNQKLVTTSVPNVSGTSDVTANKSTWTFTMGSGTNAETLIIGGGNGSDVTATKVTMGTAITAATGSTAADGSGSAVVTSVSISDKTVAKAGSAVTVATGSTAADGSGSAVVTSVSISDKTVAKAGSAVTVATGATASTGSGDAIVTGVTIGTSASAITALGTPTTATVLTGVKVTAQPTITIASGATGDVQVATGISSATATNGAVAWNNKDSANALTGLGTATTASVLNNTTSVTVSKGNA